MSRSSRKLEHIRFALENQSMNLGDFDQVQFVHQSISEIAVEDIDLEAKIGGLQMGSPIIINAMTGGADETTSINKKLAIVARETGTAIAVGSQMAAIKNPALKKSYQVVRDENPKGIIFANLGAEASVNQAKAAIEMIDADGLQIHLNTVQELVMPEGDRSFKGTLERIQAIKEAINIPLIVKEVGFGFSKESAAQLKEIGVDIIDVGGKGGTNFAYIENRRRENPLNFFDQWGISTPISILEVKTVNGIDIIATGGIRTSSQAAKALALGANAVGMAGVILEKVVYQDEHDTINYLAELHEELKLIFTALGAKNIAELQLKPVILAPNLLNWCNQRHLLNIRDQK